MEEKKNKVISWIKAHAKELIIAGVSVTAVILVIVGIKNHEELEATFIKLKKMIDKTPVTMPFSNQVAKMDVISQGNEAMEKASEEIIPITRAPHDVIGHPRKLPDGWKASAEKLQAALENGIDLDDGQTWVNSYRTGINVA